MNIKKTLKNIVEIPSVFPDERELAEFLGKELRKIGLKTKRQNLTKDRFNVIGEVGRGAPCIMFYGHMDTVEPSKNWKSSPFKLKTVNDRAYGLGVYDMKAGLTAIIETVKNFKPKNFKIKVAFGVDEENVSQGADLLVKSGWLNDVDFVIVPEIILKKDFSKENQNPNIITLGRRGRVGIKITVRGKSAHAASPHLGINAIDEAVKIISSLKNIHLATHTKLGKGSICVLNINGGVKSLSVPELAEIIIDRHLVPPETKESVLKQLKTFIKKSGLKSSVEVKLIERATPFLMPYFTSEKNKYVQMINETIKMVYGKVIYNYELSVADENYFGSRLHLPVVIIGPRGGDAHAANEWVSLQSIKELINIFLIFLQKIDKTAC